ncbi:endonuclease/exonuclease/phosphatase, partial [Actinomadura fulvescens]
MASTDVGTINGPTQSAGPSIVPQGPARLALIAITVAVLAQTLRFSLPQLDRFADTAGVGAAAGLVLLVYLAGFLSPLIRRVAGPQGLLLAGVGGLFAVRLLAQALSPQLWLVFLGTAIGMIAVAALYEGARGLSGVGFATAAVAGLAVDSAVRMAFATWDPAWRSGVWPWLACLVYVGLGVAALWREMSSGPVAAPGISWRDALGAAAFGPFLALQILILSSPAFVASSGWQSLVGAHVVIVAGQGLALAFLASGLAVRAVPGGVCVLGGTLLGVGAGAIAGTYAVAGIEIVPVVIVGQLLAAWLLAVASRAPLRRAGAGGPVWRIDVGAALGGLLVALILVPYQVSAVTPLPLPNNLLPGLAG